MKNICLLRQHGHPGYSHKQICFHIYIRLCPCWPFVAWPEFWTANGANNLKYSFVLKWAYLNKRQFDKKLLKMIFCLVVVFHMVKQQCWQCKQSFRTNSTRKHVDSSDKGFHVQLILRMILKTWSVWKTLLAECTHIQLAFWFYSFH